MQTLRWSENFATKIKDLDAANESLFYLLGHLCDQGVECDGTSCLGDSTCQKVDALVAFLTRNMAAEEATMDKWDFPAREAHAKDHNYVVTRLLEWRRVSICRVPARDAFCDFIHSWTTRHILTFDRDFGRWAEGTAYAPGLPPLPEQWLPVPMAAAPASSVCSR